MERIILPLAFVALIAVLVWEHERVAGVTIGQVPVWKFGWKRNPKGEPVHQGVSPASEEIVGLSNEICQKPGPAYLQFNQPWFFNRENHNIALPLVTEGHEPC